MRFASLTLPVTLLLALSCADCTGLQKPQGTPPLVVKIPPPPSFMGGCAPSGVKAGDPPNQAFDAEHAAFKQCSRRGAQSRQWYLRLRDQYAKQK